MEPPELLATWATALMLRKSCDSLTGEGCWALSAALVVELAVAADCGADVVFAAVGALAAMDRFGRLPGMSLNVNRCWTGFGARQLLMWYSCVREYVCE